MRAYLEIEMPKSCDECRIMVFEDTNCVPELFCGCPIVFQAHPQGLGYRPDYCPLIPVPPHGRLIDADALNYIMLYKENWMKGTGVEAPAVWKKDIEDAPTIIPVEEGET